MMIHTWFSLRDLTTFGVDAKARQFIEVHTREDLREAIRLPGEKLFLGGGSNVLFTGDYDGTVVKIGLRGIDVEREDEDSVELRVAAGENWHDFVMYTVDRDLGGVENLSLIPGTVGAAPMQNIGAYGTEMKDVLVEVQAMSADTGDVMTLSNAGCAFGYRTSIFKRELRNKAVITSVLVRLSKHPTPNLSYPALAQALADRRPEDLTVRDISDAVCAVRRSKLPDPAELGNAGSFFKNPEVEPEIAERILEAYPAAPSYPAPGGLVKIPAGWLIEQCGWKGRRVGNVGTYPKQALVLVNYGGAHGDEILAVARAIQADVRATFGISLEPEVNVV